MRLWFAVIAVLLATCPAWADDVVTNGSFEMPSTDPQRPRYWYEGWSDTPPEYSACGAWTQDSLYATEGIFSLRMSPANADGYLLSQILHVPTYDLSGKTVTVTADIRKSGLAEDPYILAFALNPALPADPELGIGLAGKVTVQATGPDDQWQTYTDSFTATDNAVCIAIALMTSGTTGSAWFDNVKVELDVPVPGPDPAEATPVLDRRNFRLGFVGDGPMDYSEKAEEEMIERTASRGEAFNVFFHVRWTHLTGEDIEVGHKERLQQAARARAARLQLVLTLDFTHNSPDGLGDLNPAPDGNPPPGVTPFDLTNAAVRNAYKQEILGLASLVHPKWVMVGIELDIFHDAHPDEWDECVAMYKEVYDELKIQHPGVKVGAYFCATWMVANDCTVNAANAADWQMLLPELDFLAYSAYPGTTYYPAADLAAGYFTAAQAVAPDLPLLLPEFGVQGGAGTSLTESEQAAYLERIFEELSTTDVEVACWYAMYDQSYIGSPQWFIDEFGKLGMHRQDGTPKEVWAVMEAAYRTPNPFVYYPPKKRSGCSVDSRAAAGNEALGYACPLLVAAALLIFLRRRHRLAAR